MEPTLLVEILNIYFSEMAKIIFKYEGTLDKFVGDMVMVVFGVPIAHADEEVRAIKTAVEMQHKVKQMAGEFKKSMGKTIEVGIGINSGEVVAGNIGSPEHMNYTVIGDAVNVAERLESMAKAGQILVSKEVKDEASHAFDFKNLGTIHVKGRKQPVEIFEVLTNFPG
jgi:adenylate cyclase